MSIFDLFRSKKSSRTDSDSMTFSMSKGSVWKVHHRNWNADLAMKRPHPRFFSESSDKTKKQFVEECDNWINLGLHPNIVSCYYVREIGGVPTIFSEWMENGSLRDRMKDGTLYEGSEEEIYTFLPQWRRSETRHFSGAVLTMTLISLRG